LNALLGIRKQVIGVLLIIPGLVIIIFFEAISKDIMKIYYISPSQIPSRSANSIHVIRMCEALASLGHDVTLFVNRTRNRVDDLKLLLENYYGVSLKKVQVVSFYSPLSSALNLQIALFSICYLIFDAIKGNVPQVIISRNLYASLFLYRIMKNKLIYETHEIEYGYRKPMQTAILKQLLLTKIVISNALLELLSCHHGINIQRVTVLPDAAPDGIKSISVIQKQEIRKVLMADDYENFKNIVGYFGHLYKGRGIEIIQALAERHQDTAFMIFGGNEEQIAVFKKQNHLINLKVMGYIKPAKVLEAMKAMDVLLMPYQKTVSIGSKRNFDTGSYMSPMKMFEYMASCVPILSSRLPVLEEVLKDGENCLMAIPDDPSDWSRCLRRLLNDPLLVNKLAENAYRKYETEYNWQTRAQKILTAVRE
jgi:glycosyltransferase involved in cell wall biosynthesis